jgi:hypothetical protein
MLFFFTWLARAKPSFVSVGMVVALVATFVMPIADGGVVAKRGKGRYVTGETVKKPDIAILDIVFAPSIEGHRKVYALIKNVGNAPARNFQISMTAKRGTTVRRAELSPLQTLNPGQSRRVLVYDKLGCNWLKTSTGSVTATTRPNPIPGERKTSNNTFTVGGDRSCGVY